MRTRLLAVVSAVALLLTANFFQAPAQSSPGELYTGTHFGDGNLPPGCIKDMSRANPLNVCYHMRTGLNALDSPQVDVLVLVPASPTAERDMRITRQAVEMWEGGIDYLAPQMGLDWLSTGVDFHITVDAIDATGQGGGGEFTTYPVVDPEIVVIATNPVGGIGIGIDPVANTLPENIVPCLPVKNPLDFDLWNALPGFDRHHDKREGIYNEDCGGSGGNVCFAINGAIDPVPDKIDIFNLFDLVSHEFGHCLTVGHVGDGAEGAWGKVPTNDIMAYSQDPPGRTKCVSTLDIEGFALRMSRYLDVNGDGAVSSGDRLLANDVVGDRRHSFQVQHPRDHLFASDSGSPLRCPQPDVGLIPGPRTDWTPTPTKTFDPVLTVTSPHDGDSSASGAFDVTGTVERVPVASSSSAPSSPSGTGSQPLSWPTLPGGDHATTYTFQHEGGNTFHPDDSTAGYSQITGRDTSHRFALDLPGASDVELRLNWSDSTATSDLDLFASVSSPDDASAASNARPEILKLKNVTGSIPLRVEPFLVTEPSGVTYTLTATVTPAAAAFDDDGDGIPNGSDQCPTVPGVAPSGCPDRDGDGVPDQADLCPTTPGPAPSGCPSVTTEWVRLFVDGALAATKGVDTSAGPVPFAFPLNLAPGDHTLRVEWSNDRRTFASRQLVVHSG